MGQVVGLMPNEWDALLEEKDRVLFWSGEVLSKVADNINQEESLRIDYSNEIIDEKIDSWIAENRTRVESALSKHRNVPEEWRTQVTREIAKIKQEFRMKVRNDYRLGYASLEKFTRKVDRLGKQQRKIHKKIQKLEDTYSSDVKKFQKKFGRLRLKTFNNLRMGEKMMFQDRRLKSKFVKKIYKIDRKNKKECAKSFDKLIETIRAAMPEE